MDIQNYLEEIKDFQKNLLEYLDDEAEEIENVNIISYIQEQFNSKNTLEIKETLQLILNIVNNHHRTPNFWAKIDKFFSMIKESLKQTLSNFEIFDFFKSNKRILLFLIKDSVLQVDQSIIDVINDSKYWNEQYIKYFLIESRPFISAELFDEIKEGLNNEESKFFEENRKIGENNSFICNLIRQDSIDDFVEYVSRTNFPLSSTVKQSIFETNSFLLNKNVSLIEYAAFFGSVQIFNYLRLNNVEMNPNLWLFVIHGRNPELVHLLEQHQIEPENKNYKNCLEESIKCYSNDIAVYIQDNYCFDINESNFFDDLYFKYRNYEFFPNNLNEMAFIFLLCKYNYIFLVNEILLTCKININQEMILKFKFLNRISTFNSLMTFCLIL
ncbi:hypothetical protein M9Y10_024586 [Tritrichomonas musculus]|uniref:DUF3447 domain-containing protein n=1 Tax=Tritrichomonas musculus TaxID=1915356 RepID=A0ABR2HAP4_9EUKA